MAFSSASVNGIVRWGFSSSFSRSASSGAVSATTFRWACVSLTGKRWTGCLCDMAMVLLLVGEWHQLIEALLDYVVPTAPQQLNPFWVFARHLHQLPHLPVHVFEETEAAVG